MSLVEPPRTTLDDCWNRIGVSGDRSCPELEKYVHCRNCPVFASAALTFYNRKAPSDYIQEWSGVLARPVGTTAAEHVGLLIFRLGVEWFGIELDFAVEVTSVKPVHRVPHRSAEVFSGIISLRGQLHLCVSMHGLLQIDPPDASTGPEGEPRVIVIQQRKEAWAFLADQVSGVEHFPPSSLGKIPSTLANPSGSFGRAIVQWNGNSVNVLDEARVFEFLRRVGQ